MNAQKEIKKLKVYTIKNRKRLEKMIKENIKKEWLSVKDVEIEYGISRKTLDRMRVKGLKISQPTLNGKILVNREELNTFLKKTIQ